MGMDVRMFYRVEYILCGRVTHHATEGLVQCSLSSRLYWTSLHYTSFFIGKHPSFVVYIQLYQYVGSILHGDTPRGV